MTSQDPQPPTARLASPTALPADSPAALAHRHWRRQVSRALARRSPEADFPAPSVWLLLLTEDGGSSQTVELTDAGPLPDDGCGPRVEQWGELLGLLAGPVRAGAEPGSPVVVSVLRTRPGGGPATREDLRWLETLEEAAESAGLPCVLRCFASRDLFRVLDRDDPAGVARSA
ncbi:hypothetical protein [Nocardioides campestrisoli]|uniref:hypothetical protein n=1 Tax=Nocardioides campestrisoli TaxID=2736757 RepID=UPI00163D786A|nr:hypothetical protein [Nocardioides campestrisoli]